MLRQPFKYRPRHSQASLTAAAAITVVWFYTMVPAGPHPDVARRVAADLHITLPLCAVFRRKLKAEGLKYTPERAKILDAVISMPGTFDAEALSAMLKPGGGNARIVITSSQSLAAGVGSMRISKATVYRTIKLLLEAGILQQVLVESEQAHYQLAYGRGPVATLVRGDTGGTEQVELPELDTLAERLCRRLGLQLRGHRFVIYADGLEGTGVAGGPGMPAGPDGLKR